MSVFVSRPGREGLRAVAAVLAVAGMAFSTTGFLPAMPVVAVRPAPAVSPGQPVKGVSVVRPKKVRVVNQADRVFVPRAIRWPRPVMTTGYASRSATRIAGTPIWVQALRGAKAAADRSTARVSATVLAHSAAVKLGLSALVFKVSGGGKMRVGLDYASFAQAFGGNYGSRLRLVSLPACAMTTPGRPACRRQTPLASVQDYRASTVSAVVSLASSAGQVVGATDSTGQEGGEGGSYAAAKLKPSGTWSEGGDSGAFTYSYPIMLPGASTQLAPDVTLNYDSQAVDGQTATTQTQSSWLGDGWGTPDSFIALSTTPCDDNPEGSAGPSSTTDMCYDGEIVQMSLNGTDTPLVFQSSATSGGVTTSQWRARADDGAVITHVSASGTVFGAYSLGQDYWTVTERDGTKYEFGSQHLPGWASGDAATNSVDTMPVFSAHSGDPCYSSSGFASSVCTMAYQWHLDYVVDTHTAAMAYYYTQATNYYGENNGAKNVSYVSDSYLDHIDYGFTDGGAYGTVPDKVVFGTGSRCVAATCGALSKSNPDVSTQYPDVPVDLICASGMTCSAQAPSMFSLVRLTSITTEQYSVSAAAYKAVDAYTFSQTEPASGDGLSPTLWLASIEHAGDDTSAGGSSAPIALPLVKFAGTDLQNRVITSDFPGLYRYRISAITTELGAVTSVEYGTPQPCSATYSSSSTPAVTSANTDSCFPVYWTPQGSSAPVLDWFESYAVTQVLTADQTGGSLTEETDYRYGTPAWHYDDNEVVRPKYRTWGQFRGYGAVTTYTGDNANNPQTETVTKYYQGMNGDTLPSGTRSVTLTDSQNGSHADDNQLAGDPLETTTYLGKGGPVESSTITSYWVSAATATMHPNGLPALTANMTETAETWTRTALTDGGETGDWNVVETDDTYDPTTTDAQFGLLQYAYTHTDPVNTAFDSCTRDQYAPVNSSKNLVGLVSFTETDQGACSGYTAGSPASVPAGLNTLGAPASVNRPSQVTKAVETFYDDTGFATTFPQAAPPTRGDVTMVRQASGYSGGAFTWQTETRSSYDSYGRPQDAYDADGNETVASYTVNSAGLTTGIQIAAPATTYAGSSGPVTTTHVSSTTVDPARNLTLTSTDQNGVVTAAQYDALGRVTSVWKDSRSTGLTANETDSYTVSATSVSGVVTQKLNEEGGYVPSVTIYDSLGRVRQTQKLAITPTGGGRLISDTLYDSRGLVSHTNTNYFDSSSAPALKLASAAQNTIPIQDDYVYDGIGRQVEDISENDANAVSTTVTVYNGDSTTVIPGLPPAAASGQIPPDAGTVKTTQINPIGQTTALVEYTANPTVSIPSSTSTGVFSIAGGTPDPTTYTYNAQGLQASVTSGGNTWTQQYNLLGQETQSTDPDSGTTTLQFDGNGNLLQSHDAAGQYVSYTYDQLGRRTAGYGAPTSGQVNYASASSPGNQIASWVYDNANGAIARMTNPKGQLTTETSYANGFAYTTQQGGFNAFGESIGEIVDIPSGAPGSAMGTSFTFTSTYQPINGTPLKSSYPAGGGLPAETVTYSTTSALDLPSAVGGLSGYAESTSYNAYRQVDQVTVGAGSDEAYVTDLHDPHTESLTSQLVTRSASTPTDVDQASYTYTRVGMITSETDQRLGSAASTETQCYAYTTQGQLSQAWTATDNCAATPTTASHGTVGDPLGTSSEYFESYTYNKAGERATQTALVPAAGAFATTTYGYSASQPTALTSTSTTGAVTGSTSYSYTADGEQATRGTSAGNQTLSWSNTGRLTGINANGSQVASYVYTPDGTLLSQTDGSSTTIYLPGEEITDSGGAIAGIRYYPLPGGLTAVRTGSGTSYGFEIASDQHGTNTLDLGNTAQNPTWRQYDPFGNARGTAGGTAATWIDNRTFLDDPTDTGTALTDVGARWYDSVTGSFASLDPVLSTADPTQIAGYGYAGNDPVSSSDPTGLTPHCDEFGDCTPGPASNPNEGGAGGAGGNPAGGPPCPSTSPGCPGYTPPSASSSHPSSRHFSLPVINYANLLAVGRDMRNLGAIPYCGSNESWAGCDKRIGGFYGQDTWAGWTADINNVALALSGLTLVPVIGEAVAPFAVGADVLAAVTNGVNAVRNLVAGHYRAGFLDLLSTALAAGAGRFGLKAIRAGAADEVASDASAQAGSRLEDGLTSFAAARQTGAAWKDGFNELVNTKVWPYLDARALQEGADAAASISRLRDMQLTNIGAGWALADCNMGECP